MLKDRPNLKSYIGKDPGNNEEQECPTDNKENRYNQYIYSLVSWQWFTTGSVSSLTRKMMKMKFPTMLLRNIQSGKKIM